MVVTIDGPAGAGKSSVARTLAKRLGFRFLDTGAMYRAVTLAAVRRQLDWNDTAALGALAGRVAIELQDKRVLLDGEDVTDQIRTPEVTAKIHYVADNREVRLRLGELQRREREKGDIVTEGRDQGTVVFPDAKCKIFLTATPQERARRRLLESRRRGEDVTLEEILAQQDERDRRDSERPLGRLAAAADALVVVSDGMTQDEVVDHLEELVRQKQSE